MVTSLDSGSHTNIQSNAKFARARADKLLQARMVTNAQLRKGKLQHLADECAGLGGIMHIAVLAECNPGTLDQILKGVLLKPRQDGTRTPRSLGNALARKIERVFNMPEGWFDVPDASSGLAADAQALAEQFNDLPMQTALQREQRQALYWQLGALIRLAAR